MFTRSDLEKYPFIPEAIEYVEGLDIRVEDLSKEEFEPVIKRAKMRIKEAIHGYILEVSRSGGGLEAVSFPIALLMLSILKDDRLKRVFALHEAKKAYTYLKEEPPGKIMELSKQAYKWDLQLINSQDRRRTYAGMDLIFKLHFSNFLRNSVRIKEARRRLINKRLSKGYVFLTKLDAARLLQEEVKRDIKKKLSRKPSTYPKTIEPELDDIRKLFELKMKSLGPIQFPEHVILQDMPPCIRELHRSAMSGVNISHIGRFALTSFLLNIGVTSEKILELFTASADFDVQKTRYQIEHINGGRGAKRKYIPPKCNTMKTHGLCVNPDGLCKSISHPLSYYRRKTWFAKKNTTRDNRVHRG